MLRPAMMHELEVVVHNDYKNKVIKALHQKGITQIEFLSDNEISEINKKFELDLKRGVPLERELDASKNLLEIYRITGILSRFETKNVTFLEEMLGVEKIEKKKIGWLNFEEVIKRAEDVSKIKDGENGVISLANKIEKKSAELSELKKEIEEISVLSNVLGNFDLSTLGKGLYYTILISVFENDEVFNNLELMYANGEISYVRIYEIERTKKKLTYAATIVIPNENANSFIQKISGNARILKESKECTVTESIKILSEKIGAIEKEINDLNAAQKNFFDENYKELLICRELLEIEKERYSIFVNGCSTEKTTYFKAYVPAQLSYKIKELIEEKSEGVSVVKMNKDLKNAPTMMQNPKVIKKFEFLTSIYGLPKYNHIDPSIVVAPVAALLIGLMIADACYGVILFGIAMMFHKKYSFYSEELKNFMYFVAICAVVAMGVGIINGEYFGNLGHILWVTFIDSHVENLPLQFFHPAGHDLKLYLQIAIGFGVIHIWSGTMLGLYDAIRRKERKEALYKYVSWCLFGLGMIIIFYGAFGKIFGFPFVPFNNEISTYTALALMIIGFLIALKHDPILSVIEAIDYFAFILSYARIMALVVAAGAVAIAFNQLAGMAWGFAFGIFAILIFIVGQTLHFFLGVLSAFVQALRLLYVEHFSRYYEGGGYEFKPFEEKRKYTYVEEQ
ncbi:MAG: V-type ATPase 116kDa subunit family protein [Candidatus Altarchaeum sp.]|nr:V-type ATPase 116kDa subunit family protein [Candidatus Altarchaeum sp.]